MAQLKVRSNYVGFERILCFYEYTVIDYIIYFKEDFLSLNIEAINKFRSFFLTEIVRKGNYKF